MVRRSLFWGCGRAIAVWGMMEGDRFLGMWRGDSALRDLSVHKTSKRTIPLN
ncbi:MAG: hypothetical protein ACKPH3_05945 [Dolichospermum sp.]